MIAILSVENTGTHFTQHCVRKLTGKNIEWAPKGGRHGFIQHVYPEVFDANADYLIQSALENLQCRVIVPMRHPVKALISNYERAHGRLPYRDHANAFKRVSDWKTPFFFQVDHPDLLDIGGLATYLGVRYKNIRNEPRNVTPTKRHTILRQWYAEHDWASLNAVLDGALDILHEFNDFFDWFGYEIP